MIVSLRELLLILWYVSSSFIKYMYVYISKNLDHEIIHGYNYSLQFLNWLCIIVISLVIKNSSKQFIQ